MNRSIVSFKCTIKDRLGKVLSQSVSYGIDLSKGKQNTPKLLVNVLEGLKVGEHKVIFVRAEDAFGYYKPELILKRDLSDIEFEGGRFQLGELIVYKRDGKDFLCRVVNLDANSVTLDANHPFAGQDIFFEVEAIQNNGLHEINLRPTDSVHRVAFLN